MRTQSKTTIILISIFILGILLGVVVDRTIIENQMKKKFARMRNPQMLGFLLERVIQPTPEQREKIDKILKKYADDMFEKRHQVMKETGALMDSLRSELEPILTEEQKKRLEEHRQRFEFREDRRGQFRRPMRPPFDEPPAERFQ